MKVSIDLEKCYRSGECYYNHPELFRMTDDGDPELTVVDITDDLAIHARQAAQVCPAAAITVEE